MRATLHIVCLALIACMRLALAAPQDPAAIEIEPAYVKKLIYSIQSNIVCPPNLVGNPLTVVLVDIESDGRISKISVKQSSDSPAWDQAVIKALERTRQLPLDSKGHTLPKIEIAFRPRDE